MATPRTEQNILLNRKEVVALVGMCYTSIYNMEKLGKFPARRRISPGRVGWVRSEVMSWVEGLACAVSGDEPGTHSSTGYPPEPNKIDPESTCAEEPGPARSRFEPWPWLR